VNPSVSSTVTGVDIAPAPEGAGRPMLERILAIAPWLVRFGMAAVARLPATSRLRRRILVEGLSRAFAAINRDDPWVIPIGYEPDCVIYSGAGFRTLGVAESYHGHEGWRQIIEAMREPLPDSRWTPGHLIDLGDRWVVRLHAVGSGRVSGVPTEQTWGSVYHVSRRGRIARQEIYMTWADALAAVGLHGCDPTH
jgi:hypothetical protein